jgi:hypothetical protein
MAASCWPPDAAAHGRWPWLAQVLCALAALCGVLAAEESRAVTLTLEGAADGESPVVLDLTTRDGGFEPEVWATAYQYNHSLHSGAVAAAQQAPDQWKLTVHLEIESDPFAPGGPAAYEIELARQGNVFTGAYKGAFLDRPAQGAVKGRASPVPVRAAPGHEPVASGEHPRLIFRKKQLPELRRHMQTPEGQAILGMLKTRAPLRDVSQVSDRHASWMAANWGALWQLTGEKEAAHKARQVLMSEVITKPLPWDRKDIHHASRLLGIALTYDLCYDAWEDEFRRLLAEYLHVTASELAAGYREGFQMDGDIFVPDPWSHRNGIRMSCVGCCALAILGDVDGAGKPLPDVERLVRVAERHVVTYLRSGITGSGCGLEGPFYRDFALANGVLQYLQASRLVAGRDLSAVNPCLLAGQIVGARLTDPKTCDFGLASISVQASGLWPLGLGSAPRESLPALKWCFDRDVGLAGRQHFGCAYPFQAAYALANYPFEVEAKPPGEALPLMTNDQAQGHFLFRSRWQDAQDPLVELYLNLQSRPALRLKSGELSAGVLNVTAFGSTWLSGFVGPSRLNEAVGAELLYAHLAGKQAFVGADLTPCYTVEPRKDRLAGAGRSASRRPPGTKQLSKLMPTQEEVREFLNPKAPEAPAKSAEPEKTVKAPKPSVTLTRHVAVDLSGECGAPVLIAIVDQGAGLPQGWRLPLPTGVATSAPGQFLSGSATGANLTGRFVVPRDARLAGGQVPAGNECFVVLTLQQGAAPPVKVEGAGLSAKVTLGGRTISFDGRRIVLGK